MLVQKNLPDRFVPRLEQWKRCQSSASVVGLFIYTACVCDSSQHNHHSLLLLLSEIKQVQASYLK